MKNAPRSGFLLIVLRALLWRPQISHFLIAFACLLITVRTTKVMDSWDADGVQESHVSLSIGSLVHANTGGNGDAASTTPSSPDKKASSAQSAEPQKKSGDTDKEDSGKKDLKKGGKSGEKAREKSPDTVDFDPLSMDENQVKVLKAMAENRKKITKDQENIEQQKKLMDLGQQELKKNIKNLEALASNLEKKEQELTKEQKKKIDDFVKIYESMKPTAAAQIFNKLDLATLTLLIKNMNQKKASIIMTNMDPMIVQAITIQMLKQDHETHGSVGTTPPAASPAAPSTPPSPPHLPESSSTTASAPSAAVPPSELGKEKAESSAAQKESHPAPAKDLNTK